MAQILRVVDALVGYQNFSLNIGMTAHNAL